MDWKRHNIRRIGLFGLSNRPDQKKLTSGVQRLRDQGVEVVFPQVGFDADFRRMNGDDATRAAAFNELLADKSIDLLLAVRGGYGVTRCLDMIDWDLLLSRNIPIVGYSDVTALLIAAYSKGFSRGICGPMLCNQWNDGNPKIFEYLDAAMSAKPVEFSNARGLKKGRARGAVLPVNLALLESLIGTGYLPDFNGRILVLEDVGEAAHRIDRTLNHLKMTGILTAVAGLVFGQFTDCEDSEYLPEILKEYASFVNGPVAWDLPFGHINISQAFMVGQDGEICVEEVTNP